MPLCAQHREGWCIIDDVTSDDPIGVNCLCGAVIVLPWAIEEREPDCVECMAMILVDNTDQRSYIKPSNGQ